MFLMASKFTSKCALICKICDNMPYFFNRRITISLFILMLKITIYSISGNGFGFVGWIKSSES